MAKVTTPVKGFNGRSAGVLFVDGVGETDNEAALSYFTEQGYTVEDAPEDSGPELVADPDLELLGNELANPDGGLDAADPENDLVPVGGVKSDGVIVAGKAKGKRVSKTQSAPTPEPGSVVAGVQETGDPTTQSANPSAPNPANATAPDEATTVDLTTGETVPTNAPADDDSSSPAPADDPSKLKSDTTTADPEIVQTNSTETPDDSKSDDSKGA